MTKNLKTIAKISILSLLFVGLIGANALALQKPVENNEKVDVLIGFYQAPGPSEQALVRGLGGEIYKQFDIVDVMAARMTSLAAAALAQNSRVKYVEPDAPVYVLEQTVPWGIDRVFGEETYPFPTWETTKGSGIAVAILDTGIQLDHPDLNVVGGVDCTKGPDCDRGGDGDDDRGHGTHVAGTVAALDNDIGVVGVAPEADLYSVKVLTRVGGRYSDVIKGIEWSVDNGMNVVNMSLGATTYSETLKTAVDVADANGLLLVAAAGNNGDWETVDPVYPAAYKSVMAIGAIKEGDEIAEFSNWTSGVELVAPGVRVLSTYIGSTYYEGNGTSMASPHVAGVAALVWAVNSNLTNAEIRSILWDTAEDLGAAGWDATYGWGLVDAYAALQWTVGPVDNPPTVSITSPLDGATVSGTVEITADATDDVGVVQVDFDVEATLIGTDTTAPYSVSWNSTTVVDGTYTLTATAVDTIGQTANHSISVLVDNVNDPPVADAGPDQSAYVGETVYFDGSDSTDDGTIDSYVWDFDDGATSTGVTTGHVYSATGTYTVTLVVTDNGGLTGSDTAEVTITKAPVGPTMHVGDILTSGSCIYRGPNAWCEAAATITILDSSGSGVADATVFGSWSGAYTAEVSGTTDINGKVTFETDLVKGGGTFTFTVNDVVKDGWIYDSTANVETSDSITL